MRICFLCLLVLVALGAQAAPVAPFQFAGRAVAPGQQASVLLAVVAGPDTAVVPVTVFHGRRAGPVLGIIAGVHGYEYAPIVAAQQLARTLDPTQLSGTVLLVHLANVPAFLGRRIHVNPQDGKNLNRVFPGRPDGSITERLAWRLSEDLIARCTHVVDVHAGDAYQDLRPYAGFYNYAAPAALTTQGRQMAVALGFPFVVQFANEPHFEGPSRYCSAEAIRRGIPAVDIECGGLGQATPERVAQIQQALGQLLGYLRMLGEAPAAGPAPAFVVRRTFLESPASGFFYPLVKAGEYIYAGQAIGYVTDLFGRKVADLTAPTAGVMLYLTATPPVTKGEDVGSLGHLAEK